MHSAGPDAVLSHQTAAGLYALMSGHSQPVHVTVPIEAVRVTQKRTLDVFARVPHGMAMRINPQYPGLQRAATLQSQAEKDFPEYF